MNRFSRRSLLKSAAGAALLGPLMREANAQVAAPARLVIVLECNSFYPVTLLSSAAKASLGSGVGSRIMFSDTYPATTRTLMGDALSTALCLGPLAASAGKISLENRAAVLFGLSSTITGGGHSTGTGALSCAVDGSAPTIDAVLASRLKRSAPFEAIRLGTSSSLTPIVYQTCSFGPKKPAPILVNPGLAYESIFGSIAGGQAAGPERSALFDFARDDVKTALMTFRGNSNERLKLERYLTSLEGLRAREAQLASMAAAVRPLLPVAPASNPLLAVAGNTPDSLKWLEAQFQIATTSLVGGLTNNVILASASSGFDVHYDSIIAGIGRHDLQHGINVASNFTAIAAITRKHIDLIAQLARTLAATPEVGASGSMLDHTAIVFMSDNGEQHHSTATEWPALVVGGNALGLKTDGRTVIYPENGKANNRQVSNLFNTLGHAFGDSSFDTFGSEGTSRIAPGPLSELI
jgi:hypothetical protein